MKSQPKHIRFDKFVPYFIQDASKDGQASEKEYDLHNMFVQISQRISKEVIVKKEALGSNYIFHVCSYNSKYKIWQLQILHIRENILPGIANDQGEYELIQLEDNQYLAESTTVLYDEERFTLYLQRNKYGISIHAFENLLGALSPAGTSVNLHVVIGGNKINLMTPSSLYRKVILAADSEQMTKEDRNNRHSNLFTTLAWFNKYQGRYVTVQLGFSRQRTGFLQAEETSKLIKEAYNFSGTQTLKVRRSSEKDDDFETIDLLDDRACFKFDLDYSRKFPITHARIFDQCLEKYKETFSINEAVNFQNIVN